jgi:predicted phosphoribosyltransferase
MLVSVRYARSLKAAKAVIAVPVGSKSACALLLREADDVVCLAAPERFFAVGEWYRDFGQVSDVEVQRLLEQNHTQKAAGCL